MSRGIRRFAVHIRNNTNIFTYLSLIITIIIIIITITTTTPCRQYFHYRGGITYLKLIFKNSKLIVQNLKLLFTN